MRMRRLHHLPVGFDFGSAIWERDYASAPGLRRALAHDLYLQFKKCTHTILEESINKERLAAKNRDKQCDSEPIADPGPVQM